MQACCIMFEEKPKMVDDPARPGKKAASFWEPAKRLLNDPTKFLDSLISFDKENIKEATIQRIEPYIAMEEFTTEAVARVRLTQHRAVTTVQDDLTDAVAAVRLRQGLCWLLCSHCSLAGCNQAIPAASLVLPFEKSRAERSEYCFHSMVLLAARGHIDPQA